jgi:hypothetical protein
MCIPNFACWYPCNLWQYITRWGSFWGSGVGLNLACFSLFSRMCGRSWVIVFLALPWDPIGMREFDWAGPVLHMYTWASGERDGWQTINFISTISLVWQHVLKKDNMATQSTHATYVIFMRTTRALWFSLFFDHRILWVRWFSWSWIARKNDIFSDLARQSV